jgi:LmbE family N-acetylglucosaminyl deacetylase
MTTDLARLTSADRVLVLAPHPDDETLATGGLLQRAAAAGAGTRVVFVTDGENNPWPQRVLESRWRIGTSARRRWAVRRRREARAALAALNVPASQARFLGLPDQGLTHRVLTAPAPAAALLAAEIGEWNPTVVVCPSSRDRHPDHSAVALLMRIALRQLGADYRPLLVHYLVHPPKPLRDDDAPLRPLCLRLTDVEKSRKRSAIHCHATQRLFHRQAFERIAGSDERFLTLTAPVALDPSHPIRYGSVRGATVALELALAPRLSALAATVFVLVIWSAPSTVASRRATLPGGRNGGTLLSALPGGRNGEALVSAFPVHAGRTRRIVAPIASAREPAALFVKLERRWRFFDDDGWREIPVPMTREEPTPFVSVPSSRTGAVAANAHAAVVDRTPALGDPRVAIAVGRTDS